MSLPVCPAPENLLTDNPHPGPSPRGRGEVRGDFFRDGGGVVQHLVILETQDGDGVHGLVHVLADGGSPGAALKVGPAGLLRHPEDVPRLVFVRILQINPGVVALP